MAKSVKCENCDGTGLADHYKGRTAEELCEECAGSGRISKKK